MIETFLAIVAPPAAAALKVAKVAASAVWNFVKQPPGSYIALLSAVALAWWLSGQIGYHRGRVICEAAHKAAANQERHRQSVAISGAKTSSDARTTVHAETNASNKQQVIYVTRTIAGRPDGDDECIDAASADRLRALN